MNGIYSWAVIAAVSGIMIFALVSCFGMGSYEDDPDEWPYAGDEFEPVGDDDDGDDDDTSDDDTSDDDDDQADDDFHSDDDDQTDDDYASDDDDFA